MISKTKNQHVDLIIKLIRRKGLDPKLFYRNFLYLKLRDEYEPSTRDRYEKSSFVLNIGQDLKEVLPAHSVVHVTLEQSGRLREVIDEQMDTSEYKAKRNKLFSGFQFRYVILLSDWNGPHGWIIKSEESETQTLKFSCSKKKKDVAANEAIDKARTHIERIQRLKGYTPTFFIEEVYIKK